MTKNGGVLSAIFWGGEAKGTKARIQGDGQGHTQGESQGAKGQSQGDEKKNQRTKAMAQGDERRTKENDERRIKVEKVEKRKNWQVFERG